MVVSGGHIFARLLLRWYVVGWARFAYREVGLGQEVEGQGWDSGRVG